MKAQCIIKFDQSFQENVARFLSQHRKQAETIIVIAEYPDIKFIINQVTGEITLVGVRQANKIQNFYSKDLFPHIITPLADALSLLAKIDLLMELEKLGDKGISNIIHKKHFLKEGVER